MSNLTIGELSCTLGYKTKNRSVIEVDVSGRIRNREIGRFATVNRSNRSFDFFISFVEANCNSPKAHLSRKARNPFFFCFFLVFWSFWQTIFKTELELGSCLVDFRTVQFVPWVGLEGTFFSVCSDRSPKSSKWIKGFGSRCRCLSGQGRPENRLASIDTDGKYDNAWCLTYRRGWSVVFQIEAQSSVGGETVGMKVSTQNQ